MCISVCVYVCVFDKKAHDKYMNECVTVVLLVFTEQEKNNTGKMWT